ncbi:MAG: mechanosensitive ion channel domain-containing protein [Halioglobus sp.]
MKNATLYFLQIVLLACFSFASVTRAAGEPGVEVQPEVESVVDTKVDTKVETEKEALQSQLDKLDQDIRSLKLLGQQVDGLPKQDREAVLFRRDERSFKVFQDLDQLMRRIVKLPAEDVQRIEMERRLRENLADAGDAAFARIEELGKRIASFSSKLESLSGGQRIASEAYISSLELLRIHYYEAQVNVIEGRKALDMPTQAMQQRVQDLLYLHAETLVGKIEFVGSALKELRSRLEGEPQNTDLDAISRTFSNLHQQYLQRLEIISGVLQRLGLDNAVYTGVLLQQGKGFSVRDLKGPAFQSLLRDSWNALKKSLVANAPDTVFRLLVFILVILAFRVLSRLTRRATVAAFERSGVDLSTLLKDVLASVSSGTVMVIGVLMALSQIGISLGPMLAGLGVAGFVVGFALQDTLSNFAAGGMILVYRPYDVDDFVEVTGASGLVKKMSLVSTTITTFDNQTLVVPNSKIWGDVIKNVTAQKVRRVDLQFGIGYGDDIEHAERVLADVVSSHELVLKKPETMIKLHTLGDSSVNFIVRPWTKTEDYWDVYWDLTREIKMRFDKEGISIPFPQRDVHFYNEQA